MMIHGVVERLGIEQFVGITVKKKEKVSESISSVRRCF